VKDPNSLPTVLRLRGWLIDSPDGCSRAAKDASKEMRWGAQTMAILPQHGRRRILESFT